MTILFTWELGGGLGHVMPMLPLARELARRGERVIVALREPAKGSVFASEGISILPAPFKSGKPVEPIAPPCTFAHVLHNVGWESEAELGALVYAWRGLFDLVRPDLVICDHSPTALLAARGLAARRIVIGLGFCCPPDQTPPQSLRPDCPFSADKLIEDEQRVLACANRVLARLGGPPLERIGQLYSEVDDTQLLTFKELDHYRDRPGEPRYRGIWTPTAGKPPRWPHGSGKRIYAYLKSFPLLPHLLIRLKGLGCPSLIFGDGIDDQTRQQFECSTMRFETEPLDLHAVAAQCDAAIVNANHGTVAALLLAGKPL